MTAWPPVAVWISWAITRHRVFLLSGRLFLSVCWEYQV